MIGREIRKTAIPKDTLQQQLTMWSWNSHLWDEETLYYFRCRWCGVTHAPDDVRDQDYPICKMNPKLTSFVGDGAMNAITKAIKEA